MGGPGSTFTWNLCFDPIFSIAAQAANCGCLTYVDDLLGNIRGPGHVLLFYLALLVATHAAGLVVEDHNCVWISFPTGKALAAALLAPFPVQVEDHGPVGEGGFPSGEGPQRSMAAFCPSPGPTSGRTTA